MSASNLGIVFGPTLLRKEDGKNGPSLNSLIETPVQTRVVELMIEFAYVSYRRRLILSACGLSRVLFS